MRENARIWGPLHNHLSSFGHLVRIENTCSSGTPDVYYALRAARQFMSGWLELKMLTATGRPPEHLTQDQIEWARAEVTIGGQWHMLCRLGNGWALYDFTNTTKLFNGDVTSTPIFAQQSREFPTKEIILALLRAHSILQTSPN